MIDLRHYSKLKYLGLILIVLVALGLGTIISSGNYIKLAGIIASAIPLFLSPFQLLLLLLVCFQFPYAFLPKLKSISPTDLKSVAQVDLNLGDLIYLIIIIKLALDFMLNRWTIRWNWKVPTKLKLLIYLFIAIGLMVQMKVLVLKEFPIFWFSTVSYLRFLSGLLLVFIVPASITNRNQLRIFVIVILGLIVIQACLGFVQFFTGFDIVRGKESELLYRGRVAGVVGSIVSYSVYLLLGLCLLIAMIIYRLLPSFLILICLFFILSSLVFTQARAAWLSFLTILGVMVLKQNIQKRIVILTVLASCFIGIVFYDTLTSRVLGEFESWQAGQQTSMGERLKLLQLAVVTGINNLFLGSGWSTFRFVVPKFISLEDRLSLPVLSSKSLDPHSGYLQIFSDLGIISLIIFLGILYESLKLAKNLSSNAFDNFWRATALGILLWLSGLVLWLAINQPGVGSVESYYMWLCLGILVCINKFNSLGASRETVLEELTYRDK